MARTPLLKCFLVFQKLIVDAQSHDPTLIGVFRHCSARKFPATFYCVAMIELTDGKGTMPVEVRLRNLDKNEELMFCKGEISFDDPLIPAQVFLGMAMLFEAPGSYDLELYANGTLLANHRLEVSLIIVPLPGEFR